MVVWRFVLNVRIFFFFFFLKIEKNKNKKIKTSSVPREYSKITCAIFINFEIFTSPVFKKSGFPSNKNTKSCYFLK